MSDLYDKLRTIPIPELSSDDRRAARELALRILRSEYYSDARVIADELRDAVESRAITNEDDLIQRIDEMCDSSEWTVYTLQNQICVMCSGNDHVAQELQDIEAPTDSQRAFFALRADVLEFLGDTADLFNDAE